VIESEAQLFQEDDEEEGTDTVDAMEEEEEEEVEEEEEEEEEIEINIHVQRSNPSPRGGLFADWSDGRVRGPTLPTQIDSGNHLFSSHRCM